MSTRSNQQKRKTKRKDQGCDCPKRNGNICPDHSKVKMVALFKNEYKHLGKNTNKDVGQVKYSLFNEQKKDPEELADIMMKRLGNVLKPFCNVIQFYTDRSEGAKPFREER